MQQFTKRNLPSRIVDQRRTLVVNHLQFYSLTLYTSAHSIPSSSLAVSVSGNTFLTLQLNIGMLECSILFILLT